MGILGETHVAIDVSYASGAPIGANAVLKTTQTTKLSTHEMLEKFGEVTSKRCDWFFKRQARQQQIPHPLVAKGKGATAEDTIVKKENN